MKEENLDAWMHERLDEDWWRNADVDVKDGDQYIDEVKTIFHFHEFKLLYSILESSIIFDFN